MQCIVQHRSKLAKTSYDLKLVRIDWIYTVHLSSYSRLTSVEPVQDWKFMSIYKIKAVYVAVESRPLPAAIV